MTKELIQCPCCDYFTLSERGHYDICDVCFWEDDGMGLEDLNSHSGPNHITLQEGRLNFLQFGACEEKFVKNVINESERSFLKYEKRII